MGSDTEAENRAPVALAPIAKPLAGKKLCKRTLKLVRRASEAKCLKRGVKEVVKSIRRGNKGLCVIAGNISPIDVITHVPVLCEEASIPYVFVPSKEDLATAGTTKRPTCCVLVMTERTVVWVCASQKGRSGSVADWDQTAPIPWRGPFFLAVGAARPGEHRALAAAPPLVCRSLVPGCRKATAAAGLPAALVCGDGLMVQLQQARPGQSWGRSVSVWEKRTRAR